MEKTYHTTPHSEPPKILPHSHLTTHVVWWVADMYGKRCAGVTSLTVTDQGMGEEQMILK